MSIFLRIFISTLLFHIYCLLSVTYWFFGLFCVLEETPTRTTWEKKCQKWTCLKCSASWMLRTSITSSASNNWTTIGVNHNKLWDSETEWQELLWACWLWGYVSFSVYFNMYVLSANAMYAQIDCFIGHMIPNNCIGIFFHHNWHCKSTDLIN